MKKDPSDSIVLGSSNVNFDLHEAVIKNALDGFFILDLKGNILEVNDAACQIDGYSREELLSMKVYDLAIMKMTSKDYIEYTKEHVETRGASFETQHRRKDGRIIDLTVSSRYLDVGEGIFFSFFRDITEQKRMIQKLKESEGLYRALIELGTNIGEAVIMLQDTDDKEGVHIFISDQWPMITGYPKEELLGMSFFDLVVPKDRQISLERHRKKISGEFISRLFELSIIRKDGTEVPVEITSSVTDFQGGPANVIYIRDVTERRQVEEKLKEYQSHLENLVAQQTHDILQSNKMLEQELRTRRQAEIKLRQQGQELQEQMQRRVYFARSLVHELKTPLTAILGAGSIIEDKIESEPLKQMAKNISRAAHNLNCRISDLTDLTRGEMGILQIRHEKINVPDLLAEIVEYMTPEADKRSQSLKLDISQPLPIIRADEDRLQQVITNLLNNALEYTPSQGEIYITARTENDNLVIEVEDSGCGLEEENAMHIFEPYYMVRNQTDKLSGLGIGLPLSKMLIEKHDGKIWGRNRPGGGSIFGFSIPIQTGKPPVKQDR